MTAEPNPRLTVIIPTRQRHDTLVSTLRTCVTQDSDRLTILVSDNASTSETREVVESYDDLRIRYINPGRRLGMSEHFDFALSHVDDGYVMFLGDDDGLMPGGAEEILDVVGPENADALIWPQALYYWPHFFDPALANCLSMRLPQSGRIERLDSAEVLASVAGFRRPPNWLPSPYWGAVRRDSLTRMGGASGQVFRSITPDMYSGSGVAGVTKSYLRTDRLMSLAGSSKHSNGVSQITGKDLKSSDSPSRQFESENTLAFHPDLDYTPNYVVLLAECLMQARDQIGESVPALDLVAMFRAALRHPDHLLNPAVHTTVVAALRRTAERHGLAEEFEAILREETRLAPIRRASAAARLLALGNPLVDCARAGVENIYDATLFADRLREEHVSVASRIAWTAHGRLTKARRAVDVVRTRSAV